MAGLQVVFFISTSRFNSEQWTSGKDWRVMGEITRFKRTLPFQDECQFIVDTGWGELEPCDQGADFGVYFGDNERVAMISLCHYHTIYQESIWVGKRRANGEVNE